VLQIPYDPKQTAMQKSLITSLFLLALTTSWGQKTELEISLNSGLFSFAGPFATSTTSLNYDFGNKTGGYANNPYGTKAGLCAGLSANLKRITRRNLIWGLDLGFESLNSKVAINEISTSTERIPASGRAFLGHNFINLYPQFGYRFNLNQIAVDLSGGFDIGYCFAAMESGRAVIASGEDYTTAIDRTTINWDVRPRIQVAAAYHKIGVYAGYAAGVANYASGFIGSKTNDCYSRLIRFGLTYRIL
jgi:hypothetical protein